MALMPILKIVTANNFKNMADSVTASAVKLPL